MEKISRMKGWMKETPLGLAYARLAVVIALVLSVLNLDTPTEVAPRVVPARRMSGTRGATGGGSAFHILAIVLGLVGAVMVVIVASLDYGLTTSAAVGGLTALTSEFYAGLAIVGALASEVVAREWK